MRIEIIQRIPLGSSVTVTLETGDKVSGALTEIGDDYIILGDMESVLTIETIAAIQKLDNPVSSSFPNPTPDQTETAKSLGTSSETTDPANFDQASEKLAEIENRFNTEIQTVQIELKAPDSTFPADELPENWRHTNVSSAWIQIKNQYENAQKINELSPKHGRIQKIVTQAKSLTKRFPTSPTLKRALAYFCSLSDNWDEARQNYQAAAVQSEKANDWFGVAVSALKLNKEDLACYSLEQFFHTVSIIDEPQAWSIYVNLLTEFNNLPAFRERCKTDTYKMTGEEIQVLLETAIYLLKQAGAEALAIEIIRKWLTREAPESLLSEACQKLDGKPVESYQFFTEFMERRITEDNPSNQNKRTNFGKKRNTQTQVENEDNLYVRAKQAADSGSPEQAEPLLKQVVDLKGSRFETAIKDLAMVLVRLGRAEEAVKILEENRSKAKNKLSWDRLLVSACQSANQHEKVIDFLNDILEQTSEKESKAAVYWQIGSAHIKLENYASAEKQFRKVLELKLINSTTAQWYLAFCISKQERYDEAKQILNQQIQNTSADAKTIELLTAIEKALDTGQFILDSDSTIEIETTRSYSSSGLSSFARFFLEHCRLLDAVPPGRVDDDGKYTGSEIDADADITRLHEVANEPRRHPQFRSNHYLLAARIYHDVVGNLNSFHSDLCCSFAFRGNDAVIEKNLDAAREWYCEALIVYDKIRAPRSWDRKEAFNSLVRYLYSSLSDTDIPLTASMPSIDKALTDVVSNQRDNNEVFDAIAYLTLRSQYARSTVLPGLYDNEDLREITLNYLKRMKVAIPDVIENYQHFSNLWNELLIEKENQVRRLSSELRHLHDFELTGSRLVSNIESVDEIFPSLFFQLDQDRVRKLGEILRTAFKFDELRTSGEGGFEAQAKLCSQLDDDCQDQLDDIEKSPTKLSIEDVYPIIGAIQKTAKAHLKWLHENRKPNVKFRLPEDVPWWIPTEGELDVQIVIENAEGRMPANALKLITETNEEIFKDIVAAVSLSKPLRGGNQEILTVKLPLTATAERSDAFSLTVYAEYDLEGGGSDRASPENLSIQLNSDDKFEHIDNPYTLYAGGIVVDKPEMFFGRKKLIDDIASIIRGSQSGCVLVYGQYRSGKSSVLLHLGRELQADKEDNKNLLVLNVGNISVDLDENSKVPISYQILGGIVNQLKEAVKERVNAGFHPLEFSIPSVQDFYAHPTPLQFFQTIFKELKQGCKQAGWGDVGVVLLIDEFNYIYDLIVADKLERAFMKHWKALLQENHFSAILVGQDVMPKFKDEFANEFGTTKDRRVDYLELDDAKRLIDEPIWIDGRKDKSRYRERAIERILDLTAGSPYYIQIICDRLVNYMNQNRTQWVTEADVEQVKNTLITGNDALNIDDFHSFTKSGDSSQEAISQTDAKAVLKVIADNSEAQDGCPRHFIVCTTTLPVDMILDDLVTREVVKQNGIYYRIQADLFKEWLIVNG